MTSYIDRMFAFIRKLPNQVMQMAACILERCVGSGTTQRKRPGRVGLYYYN